jgi:predicted ATPase
MNRAELAPAQEAAQELLALGEATEEKIYRVEGERAIGVVCYYAGEFQAARGHLEHGIALYDVEVHGSHAPLCEDDPGEVCLSYVALTLWMLGYPDQAVTRSEQAIAVAQATAHAESIAEAMICRTCIALFRREAQDARERAAAALALTSEHGLPFWAGLATVMHGWALSQQGHTVDGIDQIREGLSVLAGSGDQLNRPYYLPSLAEALGKAGQVDEGLSALEEAIESSRRSGMANWDAELQRRKGELLLAASDADRAAAEACFRRAIDIAQAQSAKSLELRAATSLAWLLAEQGQPRQARDLLAPVHGWFTEGFATVDLKEAKVLLDELA